MKSPEVSIDSAESPAVSPLLRSWAGEQSLMTIKIARSTNTSYKSLVAVILSWVSWSLLAVLVIEWGDLLPLPYRWLERSPYKFLSSNCSISASCISGMRWARSLRKSESQLLPAYSPFSNKLSAFWQKSPLKSAEIMACSDYKWDGVVKSTRLSKEDNSKIETSLHILMNRDPSIGLLRLLFPLGAFCF